jgi:hypothetical protein
MFLQAIKLGNRQLQFFILTIEMQFLNLTMDILQVGPIIPSDQGSFCSLKILKHTLWFPFHLPRFYWLWASMVRGKRDVLFFYTINSAFKTTPLTLNKDLRISYDVLTCCMDLKALKEQKRKKSLNLKFASCFNGVIRNGTTSKQSLLHTQHKEKSSTMIR